MRSSLFVHVVGPGHLLFFFSLCYVIFQANFTVIYFKCIKILLCIPFNFMKILITTIWWVELETKRYSSFMHDNYSKKNKIKKKKQKLKSILLRQQPQEIYLLWGYLLDYIFAFMNTFEGTNISGDCLVNKKLPDIYLFFLFPRLFTRLHIAFMISVEGKKLYQKTWIYYFF